MPADPTEAPATTTTDTVDASNNQPAGEGDATAAAEAPTAPDADEIRRKIDRKVGEYYSPGTVTSLCFPLLSTLSLFLVSVVFYVVM